ncbi:MAG TPA: hypothetical protein VMM58_03205, partial [Bacteroidota bacterium]|nr:hypothetical protein [Bacteroidota bacterium]
NLLKIRVALFYRKIKQCNFRQRCVLPFLFPPSCGFSPEACGHHKHSGNVIPARFYRESKTYRYQTAETIANGSSSYDASYEAVSSSYG